MSKNKKILIFLVVIVAIVLKITIGSYPKINNKTYMQDMMRFEMELNGEYKVVPKNVFDKVTSVSMDQLFEKYGESRSFSNTTIKYGKYLLTDTSEYIFAVCDKEYIWIEYEIPLTKTIKQLIRGTLQNNIVNAVEIVPFNEHTHALVRSSDEDFILDLRSLNITWRSRDFYEGATINFFTDMLECTKDLSSTKCVFTKEGSTYEK